MATHDPPALARRPDESWEDYRQRIEGMGPLPAGRILPASQPGQALVEWEAWAEEAGLRDALGLTVGTFVEQNDRPADAESTHEHNAAVAPLQPQPEAEDGDEAEEEDEAEAEAEAEAEDGDRARDRARDRDRDRDRAGTAVANMAAAADVAGAEAAVDVAPEAANGTAERSGWVMDVRLTVAAHRLLPARVEARRGGQARAAANRGEEAEQIASLGDRGMAIRALALSPDGKRLASGHRGGAVLLWDAATLRCLRALGEHAGAVNTLAFSPDGNVLASGSDDESIRLQDARSGEVRAEIRGLTNSIQSLAFSPTSGQLASASLDGTVRLWDPLSGRNLHTMEGHASAARAVAFTPDGARLLSVGDDGVLRVWDPLARVVERALPEEPGPQLALAVSSDGRLAATGDGGYGVVLWELDGWRRLRMREGHERRVVAMAFSPGGRWLVSVDERGWLKLWEPATGACLRTLGGPGEEAGAAVFPASGAVLAGGADGQLRRCEVASGQCREVLDTRYALRDRVAPVPGGWLVASEGRAQLQIEQGHRAPVLALAFSPHRRWLASGGQDQRVLVWGVAGGGRELELAAPGAVTSLAFSPGGRHLAAGGWSNQVTVWELPAGEVVHTLPGHTDWATEVAFSPDGRRMATASDDGSVRVWGVTTWECLQELRGHADWVHSLAYSPDGGVLASGGYDEVIALWDASSGRGLGQLRAAGPVWRLSFSPCGRWLVGSGTSGLIEVWDATTRERVEARQGHQGAVVSATFLPGGELLSAGHDGVVRRWSAQRPREVVRARSLLSAAPSPDGLLVATAGRDETVTLWALGPG